MMAKPIPQRSNTGGDIDRCYTPPEATRLIIQYLQVAGITRIWEPAAGSGLIAETLEVAGFQVYQTDIESGYDFLEYEPKFPYDAIVTNPPFAIDYKFVARAIEFGKPWAMLMKDNKSSVRRFRDALWTRIDGIGQVPPPELTRIIPSRRISFKMPKQGWFTVNKTGKIENNAAQFATHWYLFGFNLRYPEIAVEYNQVDRLALMRDLVESGVTGEQLERLVDIGCGGQIDDRQPALF